MNELFNQIKKKVEAFGKALLHGPFNWRIDGDGEVFACDDGGNYEEFYVSDLDEDPEMFAARRNAERKAKQDALKEKKKRFDELLLLPEVKEFREVQQSLEFSDEF